jgi:hypothetical protein
MPKDYIVRCFKEYKNNNLVKIATKLDIEFKTCKNFRKNKPKHCHHEAAPRGSKTGTQGLKGNMERSVIPPKLFEHILKTIEEVR